MDLTFSKENLTEITPILLFSTPTRAEHKLSAPPEGFYLHRVLAQSNKTSPPGARNYKNTTFPRPPLLFSALTSTLFRPSKNTRSSPPPSSPPRRMPSSCEEVAMGLADCMQKTECMKSGKTIKQVRRAWVVVCVCVCWCVPGGGGGGGGVVCGFGKGVGEQTTPLPIFVI